MLIFKYSTGDEGSYLPNCHTILVLHALSLLFWHFISYNQCDQKKLPNVYKSYPKMISLEK